MLLSPELGERAAFLLSTLAVMLTAWYGGLGPGLVATAVSAGAAALLFVRPFEILSTQVALQMSLFALTGTGISLFAQALRSAHQRAEASTQRERAAHDQVMTILESISDGFQALDREFRIVYINRTAETVMGSSRNDVIGKCIWDVYPALW